MKRSAEMRHWKSWKW